MAKATPRLERAAGGDGPREQPDSQTNNLRENEYTSDSEIEKNQNTNGDLNESDVPTNSDLNENARYSKNQMESESATTRRNSDADTGTPFDIEPDRVLADNNSNDEERGGKSEEKRYKDAGEALELALMQLGPFGLYQRYVLLMLCIPNLLAAMYSLNYVFVADQVPFRCLIRECEGEGSHFANETVAELLPEDRCRRYQPLEPDRRNCSRDHFHANHTERCNVFVYENLDTIYAEFGMACSEWQRTLVGTVRNAALPLALLLTGYISDGWGRRTAFCALSLCAGALGVVKSFAPHYRAYLALEFFEAALGYGFNSAAYVMVVEVARPSLRVAFASATGVGYGLGGVLFAAIARRVPYWRALLRVIHAPALLLPLYWLLLDESTRWLHVTGRTGRALANIRKAARWNKVAVDEHLMTAISEEKLPEEVKRKGNPWLNLVKSRVLMIRFAVCCWCWVSVSFVYYGLTINSVLLSGDKYTNFALNMAMEVVASLLIMMALERFGRKRSIFVAFLVCGIACIIPYFVSHEGAGLGLFFAGKLAITFAFNSLYVFTAELFPTDARSSALAAVSLVGRLGSVLAPQTPLLSVYVQALLYGACSGSAALLVLLAPETRRAPLPQRAAHAETMRAAPAGEPRL